MVTGCRWIVAIFRMNETNRWIVDSIEPRAFFLFTSTCDSRLSDLIVPIAGLSIVWFITATKRSGKLHSIMAIWDDRNTEGDEYYGRIKFIKIVQFFFLFFFRLFGRTLKWIYKWTASRFIDWMEQRKNVWKFENFVLNRCYINWSLYIYRKR